MPFGWSGGMNNPQFSAIDLDLDGISDLVFYDRSDRTFTAFLGKGTPGQIAYELAPRFAARFDSCDCQEWALLVDYNCDGLEDVFCGGPFRQNIQIYKQVVYEGDSVGFELAVRPVDVLSSNLRPVYNTPTDIPAIVDADLDGDIDIITNQPGSNFFTLHTNMAMERYGRCDTLDYIIGTGCWGHFYESATDNTLNLGDTVFCKRGGRDPMPGGLGLRHTGSTLLVIDVDGNGLMDVMLGDVSYPTVNVAFNHGTLDHAFMDSAAIEFPASFPIYQILFPGLFYVDLNNDQARDLIIAPNAFVGGEDVDGTMVYLNAGADLAPDFQYAGRGQFSGESIDVGRTSSPTFLDYNNDGLTDLLIGALNATLRSADSTILTFQLQLYKNVGTLEEPAFQLVDDDYLGAGSLFPPLQASAPVAADLDQDGDEDLLIGALEGNIRYFENAAAPGQPAIYVQITAQLKDNLNQTIDVGKLAAPELFDFDQDQDLDLFVGNEFGTIAFYRNVGTTQNPSFEHVTDTFGQIKVTDEYGGTFSGTSKPRFVDYDDDGTVELLLGAEDGFIYVFENPQNGLTNALIPDGKLFDKDFGNQAAPAVAPLDDSGELFYVVGTHRGGLQLWHNRPETNTTISIARPRPLPSLKVSPNPANELVMVEWEGQPGADASIRLLNALGQELFTKQVRSNEAELSLSNLPAGVYLLLVESQGRRWTGRVVKE